MLKIITAMDNAEFNKRLKEINQFNIYEKDIQYKEGILDLLKINNKFDVLILSEKLPGEINFEKLIKKIKEINKKIKFIFILENKNEFLEKILCDENIKNIFYNNKINFNEFINEIKKLEFSEEELLKKEIDKLNEIILNKNNELLKYKNNYILNENENNLNKLINNKNNEKNNKINKKIKEIKNKFKNNKLEKESLIKNNNCKIIGIINNCNEKIKNNYEEYLNRINLLKENKKILIINLNKKLNYKKINNSKNKYNKYKSKEKKTKEINKYNFENNQEDNINKYYIKINNKIKLLNLEVFIKNKKYNKNSYQKLINNLLIKNKKDFNLILIIFNYKNIDNDIEKYFFDISEKIIFITEINIEKIKKCLNLIKIKTQRYLIDENKVNILFLKNNKKNLIDKKILKNIFKGYKIIK